MLFDNDLAAEDSCVSCFVFHNSAQVSRAGKYVQAMEAEIMLILTRKVDESLIVGDEVKVTVLGIKGGQVRIGITAPRDIAVHRQEVFNKIQLERDEVGIGG